MASATMQLACATMTFNPNALQRWSCCLLAKVGRHKWRTHPTHIHISIEFSQTVRQQPREKKKKKQTKSLNVCVEMCACDGRGQTDACNCAIQRNRWFLGSNFEIALLLQQRTSRVYMCVFSFAG